MVIGGPMFQTKLLIIKNKEHTMKTTKHYFWLMLLAAVFTLGVTSCGSDGDDEEEYGGGGATTELQEKLQGTWEIYSGRMEYEGITMTIDRNTFYRYKPANVEYWDDVLTFKGNKVNGENYTLVGTQLLIADMSIYDDVKIVVKSVTSTTLILAETIEADGVSITVDLEYHKK